MTDNFSDDYQTVAERIKIFREKYPEGSLRPADLAHPFRLLTIEDQVYIAVTAAAYRHPNDPSPGVGQAWEPVPGRTQYSEGSELMVAETSAWGRAIIAVLAADSRKVASREEVVAAVQRRTPKQPSPAAAQQTTAAAPAPAVAAPVQQTVPVAPMAPQPTVDVLTAPDHHNPAENQDNKSLVDSIVLNVLKHPEATAEDFREAWLLLSQSRLLAWRIEPFGGAEPDGDGKIAIGELVAYLGKQKAVQR